MQPPVDPHSNNLKQRLGQILVESHLISNAKLSVALYEQQLFKIRLGEILVAHGWIDPQTADFFSDQWIAVKQQDIRYPLGQYLQAAGLINDAQITQILCNQQLNGDRFGESAVQMGLIIPETLEYFLAQLFSPATGPVLEKFSVKETFLQSPGDYRSAKHLFN